MAGAGVLGKDVMGIIMLELEIADASALALCSTSLNRVFLHFSHWRTRLEKEFDRSSLRVDQRRLRHGKGAKKKNKAVGLPSPLELYQTLHLARRATFRTLLSFTRVRGKVSELLSILRKVESDDCREFATGNRDRAAHFSNPPLSVKCKFPVGRISSEESAIVFVRSGQFVQNVSLVQVVLMLNGRRQVHATPLIFKSRDPGAVLPVTHFTHFQWRVLLEQHIVCRCGNVLW